MTLPEALLQSLSAAYASTAEELAHELVWVRKLQVTLQSVEEGLIGLRERGLAREGVGGWFRTVKVEERAGMLF